jgi:hypothetical protein
VVGFFGLTLGLALSEAEAKCAQDSVQVGKWCVDKYEASVWETTDKGTIKKIQKGQIKDAGDLAGKATQRGDDSDDYGTGCPDNGNGCVEFYAVSIPGVTPSSRITWFQAAAACRNAGKELLPNHVWQAAALGTPDPGESAAGSEDCNTKNGGGAGVNAVVPTGSRDSCVSDAGAFDMVGNHREGVADWVPRASVCGNWAPGFGSDRSCMNGADGDDVPSALIRGGDFQNGSLAGVFTVNGSLLPSSSGSGIGFRCGR